MGDEGVRTLAESPHLSGLHTLDLSGNAVTEAGLKALAASPYLGNLRAWDYSPMDLAKRSKIGYSGSRDSRNSRKCCSTSPTTIPVASTLTYQFDYYLTYLQLRNLAIQRR